MQLIWRQLVIINRINFHRISSEVINKHLYNILSNENIEYDEINIEEVGISREKLKELTGGHTVPQIVVNDVSIGGYDQLLMLNQMDKLEKLMQS